MAHEFSFRWVAIGGALALTTLSAQAQLVCGGRSDVVAGLAKAFQERQIGYGVVGQVAIVEIYVSASGSWTLLITDVSGRSCILAAGEGWENNLTAAAVTRGI
ncbi:hypothetical protein [Mesorhizobium sp. dw_380]|uniref:hypothetical protein n=1 Tax=Mesorhizobium sp. dw_380 TaxID=2812001 RepID=UPI001BDE9394|nr:hypothetical protein [Mesorhizobium sp. dw_380]